MNMPIWHKFDLIGDMNTVCAGRVIIFINYVYCDGIIIITVYIIWDVRELGNDRVRRNWLIYFPLQV